MAEDKDKKKKSKVKRHLKDLEQGNYVNKSYDTHPGWYKNRAPKKLKSKGTSVMSNKDRKGLTSMLKGSKAEMVLSMPDIKLDKRGNYISKKRDPGVRPRSVEDYTKAYQRSTEIQTTKGKGLGTKKEKFNELGNFEVPANTSTIKKGSGKSVASKKVPKRSTRSKVEGAAMKVAGAVQKGKKAIRKINNKAGAVKNRMEEKVLKKKKK